MTAIREHEDHMIKQTETALMGVRWTNERDGSTLFFFPTPSPGARGIVEAGDNNIIFKRSLEYEVFVKHDGPCLKMIDQEKQEEFGYRIERLSKDLRLLTIVDKSGNQSNFRFL